MDNIQQLKNKTGLDFLPDRTLLSEDLVHPSVEGVITIADRLSARLREYLF